MDKCTTPEFRVSFPAVFKPTAFEGAEPKYSVTMLFDKRTDISALKALAKAALIKKWPDPASRPTTMRNPPFRDGDKEKPDVAGYANTIFVRASSKIRPGIVDAGRNAILDETDFYAGCYARATLVAYGYDQKGNKGVAFGLQNIQKLRDGEAFSGRAKAEDDFEAVETENFLDDTPTVEGATVDDGMFG